MNRNAPVSRSGRFSGGPGSDVAQFTQSISFDWRLWEQDILGSLAHAAMLQKIGVLRKSELLEIENALNEIAREICEDRFTWQQELEDVHMNIEAELTRRAPAGAKLHTGRSRNDQISLDMRMWLRDEIVELNRDIRLLQRALLALSLRYQDVLLPGYTHLQRAQPVFFAHHLLAYIEMLERDDGRLADCFHRANVCPLGSGAIAGSTLSLDREMVAKMLGFVDEKGHPRLTQNSMDAVSDRDFAVEFCAAAALLAAHLSRLAEDWILWASAEFHFITIADAYTTGSSLMPQKKNPDVAELARGKTGRVFGNLMAMLTLLKGLPMAYNRDLQEDKERLFDSADTVRATTRLMAAMIENTAVNTESCRAAASDPSLLATDLADWLVRKGMPFRQAHHVVGAAVGVAEQLGRPLNRLTLKQLRKIDPLFDADALWVFDLNKALTRRNMVGAPAPQQVARQLARWRKTLSNR
ncbi:MAG TPA: argininosuccinate lyase [Candidatus Saccharimonadales bacterium]|nr:argininosuccinate lyase [Candidatus Saccharimonadales bacterium]